MEEHRKGEKHGDSESQEGEEGISAFTACRLKDSPFPEQIQVHTAQKKIGAHHEHQGGQQSAEQGDKDPPVILQEGFGHGFVSVICGLLQI